MEGLTALALATMTPDRFDHHALARGLAWAIAIAVPAGLLASALDEDSALIVPLSLVVLVGLVFGASVSAQRQDRGLPMAHGLVTSVVAVAVAQALGIVRRIASGDDVRAGRIVSNFLLAIIAGTIGGLIGSRRAVRSR